MSDMFSDVSRRISDAMEDLGRKTDDMLTVQSLKLKRRNAKRAMDDQYIALGKIVYGKYKAGNVEIAEEAVPFCEKVEEQKSVIEGLDKEIAARSGQNRKRTDQTEEEGSQDA